LWQQSYQIVKERRPRGQVLDVKEYCDYLRKLVAGGLFLLLYSPRLDSDIFLPEGYT